MKRTLLGTAALLASLALPSIAAADVVDDFSLVGDGYTITFSEPATGITPDHPHGVYLTDSVLATINGGPGTSGSIQILANVLPTLPSLVVSIPGFPVDAIYGNLVDTYTVVPISNPTPFNPDDLQLTLTPGTYSFTGEDTSTSDFVDFSLTITQEPSTALTPEPGTFALLSTALACGGITLRRRLH